jgi:hypothetical protein
VEESTLVSKLHNQEGQSCFGVKDPETSSYYKWRAKVD